MDNTSSITAAASPTPHRWAEVLKALADGHTIQHKYFSGVWEDYEPDPSAAFSPLYCLEHHSWRIKPTTRIGWINIYPCNEIGMIHPNKEDADKAIVFGQQGDRIACIPITYTEGEGLTTSD